jgi:hypothetical protein
VATLERVLDLRPDLVEARLELAVAYFALGAYDIAVYHFDILRGTPDLPPEIAAEIEGYSGTARTRVAPSALSGFVEAGPAYGFVDGGAGIELGFGLTWRYSFDGPTERSWITELRAQSLIFPDEDTETVSYFLLRTGPEFSLDGTASGAKLRPFLSARSSVDFDLDDRSTLGAGLQYFNSFGPSWSGFAVLEAGGLRRTDLSEDINGRFVSGQIGASYLPNSQTVVRFSLRGRQDETERDFTDVTSYGARIDLRYAFRPGFSRSDRNWILSGYALAVRQNYGSLSPSRTDRIYGFGAALRAYLSGDYYVEARADGFERDTDLRGVATARQAVSVVFGRDF